MPDDSEVIVEYVHDPHHEGGARWGMDNRLRLYHRSQSEDEWTRVRRISYTPVRVRIIAALIDQVEAIATEEKP